MKRLLILLAFLPLFGYSQIKVSEMTSATSVGDSDIFLLIQGGSSKKVAFSVFDYGEAEVATQIGDSLTDYRVEVANQIHDSIPVGSTISIGTQYQIPSTNPLGTDFVYSDNLTWNGTSLVAEKGTRNIFIGTGSGANTTGADNTFLGYATGASNIIGSSNVFLGSYSGYTNSSGNYNVFNGLKSGYSNTTGSYNIFSGFNAGFNNTTGSYNTFLGYTSGYGNISGVQNVFLGDNTGYSNTTGNYNVLIGNSAGSANLNGDGNIALGRRAGWVSTTGDYNIFIGTESGYSNQTANNNTFVGYKTGHANTTGNDNSYFGVYSGYTNTTGVNNVALGGYAGYNNITGSSNVFLGYQAGLNETGSNRLYITNNATDTLIYGEFDNDSIHFNADISIDGNIYADNIAPTSGNQYEIPYLNAGGSGYDVSSNFTWNDTTLTIQDVSGNIFIGLESGEINTSNGNTFIGTTSGRLTTSAYNSTFTGNQSGYSATTGFNNCFYGNGSGRATTTTSQNTYIGTYSGYQSTGAGNIFIGYNSGYSETGSNKLYIENSNIATPLIYGEFDNNYVQINDSLKVTKSITFGENEGESHVDGKTYYDTTKQALTFFNDVVGFTHELGYEHVVRFYNNTGSTLTNGTVVRSTGSKVNGAVTFTADLAGNGSLDSLQGIAMVTADVLTGNFGVATLVGQVNGLNTAAFSDNDLLWVGHMGEYVNTSPTPPSYSAIFARIVYADADSGAIYIFPIGNTGYRPLPAVSISFSRETETINNPGITIPILITNVTNDLYTSDYSVGFTFTGDSLSPMQDGIYAIGSQCAFQGDAASADDWRVGIFVNGVEQFSVLRTSSASNKGVVAVSKILSLDTGDWVSLRVENTTNGTRDSVFTDGVVNIEYITSQ